MVLEKMGMIVEFINMVKVLFQDMGTTICINGGISSSFKLETIGKRSKVGIPFGSLPFHFS
jgi:hypothetical protein